MQSKPAKEHFIDLSKQGGEMGREDCQEGWHRLVYNLVKSGQCPVGSVLDVGAGLGFSRQRIPYCSTQDPGYPFCDLQCLIRDIRDNSFDMVTAFDVIEHVVEDVDFLDHLVRIARKWVFVATPNLNVSRAANGCHAREYLLSEFAALFAGRGELRYWIGDGPGWFPIEVNVETIHADCEQQLAHQAILLEKR